MNIRNAENAYILGKERALKFQEKAEDEWIRPLGEELFKSLFALMPEKAKNELRKKDPEAFDYVVDNIINK